MDELIFLILIGIVAFLLGPIGFFMARSARRDIRGLEAALALSNRRIAALETGGGASSAPQAQPSAPEEIADELERNTKIAEVTYRASGDNWVALSGYYSRADYEGDDLIFYAKFMFNDDGSHLSAFEISYPEGDRVRFDPIVERLEDTLSAPRQ